MVLAEFLALVLPEYLIALGEYVVLIGFGALVLNKAQELFAKEE